MSTDAPRGSRRRLAQRRTEMPIIDGAHIPLGQVRGHPSARVRWTHAWLRFVRPVVVALFWLVIVRYAWTHFFGVPDDLPVWQQIALYSAAVLVIVLGMLTLVPVRKRELRGERGGEADPSTLHEISQFANVSEGELAQLQQAQRLVVHHDDEGVLHRAEDTDKLLR